MFIGRERFDRQWVWDFVPNKSHAKIATLNWSGEDCRGGLASDVKSFV